MVKLTLKDGSVREAESGVSAAEIIKGIGTGLYKAACCVKLDGVVCDLRTPVEKDCTFEVCTFDSEDGKKTFWHTASHILAQAVKRVYPEVKLSIGPSIENGFYYDFDTDHPFTSDDLAKFEAEMKKIVKEGLELSRFELTPDEAVAKLTEMGEPYKVELCKEHSDKGEKISFYKQGEFIDLCAGPHLMSVAPVKAFKLTNCTGAYWRGDSKGKQLCRIYGTAFPKASELEAYLKQVEEAKNRDHNKIGRELEYFTTVDYIGQGLPILLPKGAKVIQLMQRWVEDVEASKGCQLTKTPYMAKRELYKISGHWDHYRENMYFTQIDGEDYAVKPMNCPGGILYFKTKQRSYKELPKRVGEFGLVHRHELHGALHGLFRVRCFTQDDAHIFMTPEQMEKEVIGTLHMYQDLYSVFGLQYHVELSTRPENSMGSDELWEISTNALRNAIEDAGVPYVINEGDGAFYGPKLDFHIEDSLGRTWQCGTIQMDMQLPERFDVNYIGEDGEKHRAVMIHRAGYGSLERFLGILIEHFGGAFPTWFAPVQVKVIPVAQSHLEYAKDVADTLAESNIRVELEEANETLGYKIRKAQTEKVPYMLIIGDKEIKSRTVSVRTRNGGDEGSQMLPAFIARLIREIKERSL